MISMDRKRIVGVKNNSIDGIKFHPQTLYAPYTPKTGPIIGK